MSIVQTKQCISLTPCTFEKHCVHKMLTQSMTRMYFSPPNTGEACPYYELATSPIDHHDEIMSKMGALA